MQNHVDRPHVLSGDRILSYQLIYLLVNTVSLALTVPYEVALRYDSLSDIVFVIKEPLLDALNNLLAVQLKP